MAKPSIALGLNQIKSIKPIVRHLEDAEISAMLCGTYKQDGLKGD
jgi:hypothetical protein